jgi:hypothetical protein
MALADDIRALHDRTLVDLAFAHDYYADTKVAWSLVKKIIAAGRRIKVRNVATGTVTNQVELAVKSRGYVTQQLAEATFQ